MKQKINPKEPTEAAAEMPFRSRVSASAINTFERCPKQFVLKHLDRRPVKPRTSLPLVIGNATHHALQKFFGLPPDRRALDDLHDCLRSVWHLYRCEAEFASREAEAACGNEALKLLTRFHWSFDTEATPLAREEWIQTLPLGTEISCYGKVDRVDVAPGRSGLQVIDYKTGSSEIDPSDLPGDRAAQIYLLGVADDFGEAVSAVRYLYLASGQESAWQPEPEDIEAARDSLELVTAQMLHARELEATSGDHCRFCPFKRTCVEANATDPAEIEPPEGIVF